MSREQEQESSEAECNAGDLELEDKEYWLCGDDNTCKQEDRSLLGHTESFLHQQDVLQENKVSNTDDRDFRQSVPIEEEDENSYSDSDTDDNVKIIIGNIKISPYVFMEMLRNVNSQTDQDPGTSASVPAIDTTPD